ncbi:uncharacterized protein LOC124909826 [Impatiens glandulifera]|uniref:uncharacterized protein LOC124909826 n=1 Tax=Impatiens glandulifera TaxID=253017 RepID=UPI001FB0E726|nr:uncharacterized protein LOC124909826 [Impatiens glandulifera]
MEIPEFNLISNFEAGVNCLQNPSLFSRVFDIYGGGFPIVYSFWKWGALFIALLASFKCIVSKVKILIIAISNRVKAFAASQPPIQLFGDDFDSDDDSDDACSSASSDDDIGCFTVEENFSVAGSRSYDGDSNLRRRRNCWEWDRFALSDLAAGKGVVKIWDCLGLGLDFEDESNDNVVSLWDLNKNKKISSFNGVTGGDGEQIPAVSMASPSVILSALSSKDGNVKFGAYDRRIGLHNPSILAEWTPTPSSPRRSKVVGIDKKVYVIDDDVSSLTVGDMRNVKSPLRNVTESDGDKWWDTGR